jgi:hypothetical protein
LRAGAAGENSIPDNSTSAPRKRTISSRIGSFADCGTVAVFGAAGGFVAQPLATATTNTSGRTHRFTGIFILRELTSNSRSPPIVLKPQLIAAGRVGIEPGAARGRPAGSH